MIAASNRPIALGRLWQIVLVLILAACSPTPPAPGPGAGSTDGGPASTVTWAPKAMTIAIAAEPENLSLNALGGGGKNYADDLRQAIHHRLSNLDDRQVVQPQLVETLPSRDAGTWLVRSDGTMQVSWTLRPNLKWHDGTPVTAHDFVFAWQVALDPELGMSSRNPAQHVNRIDTPDERTLVMEWSQTSPLGSNPGELFGPLPAHLLEQEYNANKTRFQDLAYWKEGFIGTGPFRVTRWDAGSALVVEAFEGFYLGRPRLDRITYRFISNAPTTTSNLLAGAVDGVLSGVQPTDVVQVRDRWIAEGRTPVVSTYPATWTHLTVQFRVADPPDILDVRVRRALLLAIDRQSIVDTFTAGLSPVADTWFGPGDVRWDWVSDVVTRYPYDPPQAHRQLAEVGWRRGGDGLYLNAAGQKVNLPLWTSGTSNEPVVVAISNYWKTLGIDATPVILGAAQAQDNQLRAAFPALDISGASVNFDSITRRLHTSGCPSERNRWAGSNRGCYQNATLDRVSDALTTAIDADAQRPLWRQLVQIETEELPILPMNWNVQVFLFRDGVRGITNRMLNIAEWDVT